MQKSYHIGFVSCLALIVLVISPAYVSARHFLVTIQSVNSKFVSAENGGGGVVNANRDRAAEWEKFTLLDIGAGELENGDKIVLKTSNGKFLSAIDGGGGQLLADKNTFAGWETFKITVVDGSPLGDGSVVNLKTEKGFLLTANIGGDGAVSAGSRTAGPSERFRIRLLGPPVAARLSGPFENLALIGPQPVGVDDTNGASTQVFQCRNNYFGSNFPNCYRNHEGTDFMLVGGFATMNLGSINVYTAAAGVVVSVADGHPDRCYARFPPPRADAPPQDFVYCPNDPNNEKAANVVVVLQDDGLVAFYFHLKRETVAVSLGQRVECGQLVGKVGSSGVSSAPHMHFTLAGVFANKAFPKTSGEFDDLDGNRSIATMLNPYSPMLWEQLVGRIPKKTCGGPASTNNGPDRPGSCGLGQSCNNPLGCQVGLVLDGGVCKRVIPPGGSCGGNQICAPGFQCDGGKCVPKKPDPPKRPNIKIP